jgi:CheY-like chemotaxis protein
MPAVTMKELPPKLAETATQKKLKEQVRWRAFELYEGRGHEHGHALDDWLQAEIDITGMPRAALQSNAEALVYSPAYQLKEEHPMREHKYKALILDSDPDALLALQRTLENSGVDTTITWDNAEARNLIRDSPFDVVLVGDHPPEVSAETTVRDFRHDGALTPCVILRTNAREVDSRRLLPLGVVGVAPKRDPHKVLEEVRQALA